MADPLDDLDDILTSPVSRPRTSYLGPTSARPATSGPPPQAAGGWASSAGGSPAPRAGPPVGRRFRAQFNESSPNSVVGGAPAPPARISTWDDDETTAIPMIPDLEDVQDEDLALQVAAAPMAPVNRVATMQELNDDLFKHPTFMSLEEIDLQLLTRNLSEPADLHEPDRPWIWDVLFTEVLTEVQDEDSVDPLVGEIPTPKPSASLRGRRAPSGRLNRPATLRGAMPYKMM